MHSSGNAPNAEQKRWREMVRRVGCICTGGEAQEPTEPVDIEIHHCLGATARVNRVDVGHWYILPLHWRLHNIASDFPDNITRDKIRFTQAFGSEKSLFMKMIYSFLMTGIELPFDIAVLNAIATIRVEP